MKRIAFYAITPMNYALFRPVHLRMAGDPRLGFEFTGNFQGSRRPEEMYRAAGLSGGRVVHKLALCLRRYDAFATCNFRTLPWRARRRVQLFHGLSPVSAFLAAGREELLKYDRLFLYGPHMRRRLLETGTLPDGDPRMLMVGWPKLDALVDGSLDRGKVLAELGLDPSRRTVLYAPGWKKLGSLPAAGEEIVRALDGMGLNVLVKLHDRSRDPAFSSGVDWGRRIEGWRLPGVRLAHGFDAVPCMAASDLMVTDVSSISYEYCVLDRPVVIFDVPGAVEAYPESGQEVWRQDHGRTASDAAGVRAAVERALADPGEFGARRRWKAQQLYYEPGGASARAAGELYRLLELDPPAPERAGAAPSANR